MSLIPVGALLIFAWMHSGSRAVGLCENEGFSGTGSLSLWPPGARCTGAEPAIAKTLIDPAFFFLVAALTLLLSGAAAIARPRPAQAARRPPAPSR